MCTNRRSSLRLGLWVGSHLALTDFGSEDPEWTLTYGFVPYMIAL